MAIDTGLQVTATDIERRGGLQYVAICAQSNITAATADNGAGKHEYSSITETASLHLFELKNGTGSMSVTGSKEGGTMMFEQTLSFYVPNCSTEHLHELEQLKHEPLVCLAIDFNNAYYVVGLSEAYKVEDNITRNQTYATMTGLEVNSGAALSDESGVTVTITCTSGELPYVYTGSPTLDTNAGTLALA